MRLISKCRMGLALMALFAAIGQRYFVINTTPSFPLGVYRKLDRPAHKGDLVLVCPPDLPIFQEAYERGLVAAGMCSGSMGYLIKQLVATEGDYVCISAEHVIINGERLENSQRQALRLGNIEKVPFCGTLNEKEVLLMSPHPLSFDSRYFGTISASTIQNPLTLWIRKE